MHDALGHELSLLALRAGTLQVAADLPERHREAAAGLRAATADAVDRLHEIVGVLRAEEAEPGPAENDSAPRAPTGPRPAPPSRPHGGLGARGTGHGLARAARRAHGAAPPGGAGSTHQRRALRAGRRSDGRVRAGGGRDAPQDRERSAAGAGVRGGGEGWARGRDRWAARARPVRAGRVRGR
ncbi:histidine kinase [Streptomyces sp. SolWspMP-sol7th]|uniref:histidine kinase n=1 Tax=Streptomyces sp. SolWspMP-sol7th TaxID=1839776 RepID=UPI0020C752E2|nr:histidine kinase [Streptomyces sp. SolWspMP-sol7th]